MKNEKKPEMLPFSSRLKSLRKGANKRQTDIAELLGCSASHYQKIEYGEINIPAISLMTLADYFGVTTDYLLGRSDERE